MASQTQGIQQLLAAEKKAAEKVAMARKRKARRMKQAREEASYEINTYRQERERQFRDFEAKYMGTKGEIALKIDKETDQTLEQMAKDVTHNRDKVIEELILLVCDVKPEIHRNYELLDFYQKI